MKTYEITKWSERITIHLLINSIGLKIELHNEPFRTWRDNITSTIKKIERTFWRQPDNTQGLQTNIFNPKFQGLLLFHWMKSHAGSSLSIFNFQVHYLKRQKWKQNGRYAVFWFISRWKFHWKYYCQKFLPSPLRDTWTEMGAVFELDAPHDNQMQSICLQSISWATWSTAGQILKSIYNQFDSKWLILS